MDDIEYFETEKLVGPSGLAPADPAAIDAHRRKTYLSYESFLRDRLAELDRLRPKQWRRDYGGIEAYLRSVEPMRERFKGMLGFWIEPPARPPVRTWDEEQLQGTDEFAVRRFRLEVREGLETYAVELIPTSPPPHPGLLAQHGYGGTPECVCGLTAGANREDYSYRSLGIRAARRGFHVVAVQHPSGYGSVEESCSSIPDFIEYGRTYGKNRLHRLAIMGGATMFGLDMLASSRGVDLLIARDGVDSRRIGMYGLSQGGQSSLYLPAMDQRIGASVASAWFNWRFVKMIGPHRALCYLDTLEEDKFYSDIIRLFSDSDVASLIAPRAFAVEAGLKDTSVDFEKVQIEFERARHHYEKLGIGERIEFIPHAEGHVSATRRAFEFLRERLGVG